MTYLNKRTLTIGAAALTFVAVGLAVSKISQAQVDLKRVPGSVEQIDAGRKKIDLDGKTYFQGQVLADFLDTAFTDRIWWQGFGAEANDGYVRALEAVIGRDLDPGSSNITKKYEALLKNAPWFAEYTYRTKGWPDHNVINKWPADITIGLNWPAYGGYIDNSNPTSPVSGYNVKGSEEHYDFLTAEVRKIIPILERSTGRKVSFVAPENEREKTSEFARIRIIPLVTWMHRSALNPTPYNWNPIFGEGNLLGAVSSVTSSPAEMDAYYLPEADNSIGMAVCKVNMGLPKQRIKSLIKECLTRSLGFPGKLQKKHSILGAWRMLEDTGSVSVTQYDERILSLLYCPEIKSGMDKNDFLKVVSNSNSCVSEKQ